MYSSLGACLLSAIVEELKQVRLGVDFQPAVKTIVQRRGVMFRFPPLLKVNWVLFVCLFFVFHFACESAQSRCVFPTGGIPHW